MADPNLSHNGNGHGVNDFLDNLWITLQAK